MTRNRSLLLACLAAVSLAGCDVYGREHPPGYTDDGVKFDEDDWLFNESTNKVSLWYFGSGTSDPMIWCDKKGAVRMLEGALVFRTFKLEALQQWPQPPITVRIGSATFSELPTLAPKPPRTVMTVRATGREKSRLIAGIESGDPITMTFADKSETIPGVPQSMREAFAEKCMGKG